MIFCYSVQWYQPRSYMHALYAKSSLPISDGIRWPMSRILNRFYKKSLELV